MVGPVNGASAQQVAIANPFQQENTRQTQDIQKKAQETARAQSPSETRETERDEQNNQQQLRTASSSSANTQPSGGGQGRGSIVDISV
ncbi:MAG: hypothetical protein CO093_00520 [Alphaproteobacteria bacterium CG_4_9_14_3_um_filter_47_13]|nr:MAG: hypothetical protein CO093_00520 [Alphaproteobacteria bacterium CG_4_9_14_3_um_filter_47_13]